MLIRDPAPEIIEGDPDLVAACIEGLETKHRYTCATLSFAPDEIDLKAWINENTELRHQISAALLLWQDVAWAGIPQDARPPLLVSTHLHTGRLEVNILAPRAVLRKEQGRSLPRAWNPHPPTGESRAIWAAYQDMLNNTYGWYDPGDPTRAAAISAPG